VRRKAGTCGGKALPRVRGSRFLAALPLRGLALLIAMGWHSTAVSAPRDAISKLPGITLSSDFTRIDPSGAEATVEDNLYSKLDFDWRPPQTALPKELLFKHSWHTTISMKDNLNRSESKSSDNRFEDFRYKLSLERQDIFNTSYTVYRKDVWSASTTSNTQRRWESGNEKIFHLGLTLPDLPTLDITNTVTDSYLPGSPLGTNGSSTEYTRYLAGFEGQNTATAYVFGADVQSWQTRTLTDGRPTDGGKSNTALYAMRSMPLGNIGSVTLNARYDQWDSTTPGLIEGSSTRKGSYGMNVRGGVLRFPATYEWIYAATNQTTLPGYSPLNTVDRTLKLSFKPVEADGRSATLTYLNILHESEDASTRDSMLKQNLRWDYKLNARTSGSVDYWNTSRDNLKNATQTQNDDSVTASLAYNIPGGRGSLGATLFQSAARNPSTSSKTTTNSMSVANSLTLSPQSSLGFSIYQLYSDVGANLFQTGRTDTLRTHAFYSLYTDRGYSFDADWTNELKRDPSEKRTLNQALILNATWRPQQNWLYRLTLNTNDNSTLDPLSGANGYLTSDTVTAHVEYSF
jgi:hypothetical protein